MRPSHHNQHPNQGYIKKYRTHFFLMLLILCLCLGIYFYLHSSSADPRSALTNAIRSQNPLIDLISICAQISGKTLNSCVSGSDAMSVQSNVRYISKAAILAAAKSGSDFDLAAIFFAMQHVISPITFVPQYDNDGQIVSIYIPNWMYANGTTDVFTPSRVYQDLKQRYTAILGTNLPPTPATPDPDLLAAFPLLMNHLKEIMNDTTFSSSLSSTTYVPINIFSRLYVACQISANVDTILQPAFVCS